MLLRITNYTSLQTGKKNAFARGRYRKKTNNKNTIKPGIIIALSGDTTTLIIKEIADHPTYIVRPRTLPFNINTPEPMDTITPRIIIAYCIVIGSTESLIMAWTSGRPATIRLDTNDITLTMIRNQQINVTDLGR